MSDQTTLQAARDKGFNAIGVEQDEDYIQLIGERLGWSAA
ncbi:MAG: site-specific DNA-methyltransferase [Acidipropionibacterium jensenii]|nr:site-specific DNA-methyltransferase [Acidipropionibacterium jensenii]